MNVLRLYNKKPIIVLAFALIIIGFFVYAFNIPNKLFWDDADWIINNKFVHSISSKNIQFWFSHDALGGVGLTSNYYRPFLFFTFALNYLISGVSPWSYHLVSNGIHIINSVLAFLLILQLFKTRSLAFLTALIFLIHPLQTEAVTYISGRGDVLVAFFMLSGLLLFCKDIESTQKTIRYKLVAVALLILGLLSRETAIIFPILLLLVSCFYAYRDTITIRDSIKTRLRRIIVVGFLRTWPYFAVVIVYGVLRLTTLNFVNTLNFYNETNVYSQSIFVRLFTFLPILAEYISLLFIPIGLHMERSAIIYTSFFQWPVWGIGLILAGVLYWVVRKYRSELVSAAKRNLLASDFKILFLGVGWFFIALSPVSGLTPINALIYEHWLYLPMVGFWLIVSFYILKLLNALRPKRTRLSYMIVASVLALYFLFFGYQTIQRNRLWGNEAEFYKDILKYEPQSSRINNNLANLYYNQKDITQAEVYYKKAIASGDFFAQPYYNLGSIAQSRGDMQSAIGYYQKALEIDPRFFYPHQNLAGIYAQQGNFRKAAEHIEQLKLIVPDNPRVYYNSALVYSSLNNKAKALEDITRGLQYAQPGSEMARLLEALANQLR